MYRIQRIYTRDDPRGRLPHLTGLPDLDRNRLAFFWRPIVDLVDTEFASLRLRMFAPVSEWLADPQPGRWPWFSMIGVPGLRHQVLMHAGLHQYDCRKPADLPAELYTPGWERLVEAIARYAQHCYSVRALIVFHLAQLSYTRHALQLAGNVVPNGAADHDHFVYHVARLYARHPERAPQALRLFDELVGLSRDPLFTLSCCFQGIGHAIRSRKLELARRFEEHARRLTDIPDEWYGLLIQSRFHRALAALRRAEGRTDEALREVAVAIELDGRLAALSDSSGRAEWLFLMENRKYLLELQISLASVTGDQGMTDLCEQLSRIDPYCVDSRLLIGDGYAAIADYQRATTWYSRAGELGTASGAVGWFRAAQCYEALGENAQAIHAMGRCLELDASAVEPKIYLAKARSTAIRTHS